jgi:hypothetical protein
MRKPALLALACLSLGCATPLMQPVEDPTRAPPAAQTSRVVFLRPSWFAGLVHAPLFDVSGGEPAFIGAISTGEKVVLETTPGEHRFMVAAETADFMDARMAPGRTYYAVVRPGVGIWGARFSLWPVKADPAAKYSLEDDDLEEWVEEADPVASAPAAEQWYRDNLASVRSNYDAHLAKWEQKSSQDRAARSLDEADGVSR